MANMSRTAHELLVKGTLRGREKALPSQMEKSLRYATLEGAFMGSSNTIMNTYLAPFAIAMNATNIQIGLLSSVKALAETFSQIPGAKLTKYFSRKAVWNYSTVLSRLFLIPVLLLPFFGNNITLLIALVGLSYFFSSLRTPAWTSLIGDLVPQHSRGRYFGRRNMIIGIAGLVTVLAAGNLVPLVGFQPIFAIAIAFTIFSMYFFRPIYESGFHKVYYYTHSISFSFSGMANAIRINRNLAMLTIFLSSMSFATNIAAPFFVVYMLRDLNIGYGWFTVAVGFNALAALIAHPYWGRFADKYGERKVLAVTGVLVTIVPFFYLFVTSPLHVVLAEGFAGFAWAGFDLTAFNFVLAVTPAEKRPAYVANHSFIRGIAMFAGTLIGGIAAQSLAQSQLLWLAGLQIVFVASFVMRVASLLLIPRIADAMARDESPVGYVLWQAVAVEPARGVSHFMSSVVQHPYSLDELKKKVGKLRIRRGNSQNESQ